MSYFTETGVMYLRGSIRVIVFIALLTSGCSKSAAGPFLRADFSVEKFGGGAFCVDAGVKGERLNPAYRYRRAVRSWRWDKRAPGSVLKMDMFTLIQELDPEGNLRWLFALTAKRQKDSMRFPVAFDMTFSGPKKPEIIDPNARLYTFRTGFAATTTARICAPITNVTVSNVKSFDECLK